MDGTSSFQTMLADIRQTFNKKIPGGLSDTADGRLQRTLTHYVKEVGPSGKSQDILRLTYDSMAAWFRRNLTHLSVQKEPSESFKSSDHRFESEVDPDTLFANIKSARSDLSQGPGPAPFQIPDLAVPKPRIPKEPYVQQKDVLQPQEDVVKYREVEYNLVMNSKDRDWLQNITQNRYNFVIQFNTNYTRKGQGFGIQANIQQRLRNIIRLEFIKTILPVEGLSVILPKDCSSNQTLPENAFSSVLALPSINVLVDEIEGNNFGTSNDIDKSLAVCQYDATWRSECLYNRLGLSRGYTLFFPKFMKAQRVYSPTPLANLQTLSFRIQDPENNLLSKAPDASLLSAIAFSSDVSGSCYYDPSRNYIFLKTKEWFPLWSYSQLDKILIQGLTPSTTAGSSELCQWLQNSGGHTVIGTAAYGDISNGIYDVSSGYNSVGYANWVIIQNRLQDPTNGGTGLQYFSGSLDGDNTLATSLVGYPQSGGILNLSRQVQVYVRVITREYDLVSKVRTDNV